MGEELAARIFCTASSTVRTWANTEPKVWRVACCRAAARIAARHWSGEGEAE